MPLLHVLYLTHPNPRSNCLPPDLPSFMCLDVAFTWLKPVFGLVFNSLLRVSVFFVLLFTVIDSKTGTLTTRYWDWVLGSCYSSYVLLSFSMVPFYLTTLHPSMFYAQLSTRFTWWKASRQFGRSIIEIISWICWHFTSLYFTWLTILYLVSQLPSALLSISTSIYV